VARRIEVQLAGRRFGSIKLDVSPRTHELDATDTVALPNSLDFAGVAAVDAGIVDVHGHAAEKLIHSFGRLTVPKRSEKPGQLQPTTCAAERRERSPQPRR
jgi:hypothetical protein